MVFLITTTSLRHRSGWHLAVRRHSVLLADSCQLTANSLQLTADSFYLLTAFLTTVTDSSLSLQNDALPWVLLYRQAWKWLESQLCRLFNVILNGGKNALWERREMGWWGWVKNLWHWWRLTVLYKNHGVGRQKELLAHVVRLRILACRNDLNHKRIVSL